MSTPRVCLIGLGEVGAILAADLQARGVSLTAYDLKFSDTASAPHQTARALNIAMPSTAAEAARGADIVISAVTAAQTEAAAQSVTAGLARDALFLDLNSASPGAKAGAAAMIEAAGGGYVEAAVMSPFPPKRLATAILIGGPRADAALARLQALGFSAMRVFSTEIGKASAAKMCRSVMVKGIEALLSESLLAARAHGVDGEVLASLDDLFPGPDWKTLSRYMISRTLEHGRRRAEEMRESARTVAETGVEPLMATAIAARQDWAPLFAGALSERDTGAMLDAIRTQMTAKVRET